MSLQRAYTTLLSGKLALERYLVYFKLLKFGYRVRKLFFFEGYIGGIASFYYMIISILFSKKIISKVNIFFT